MLRFRHRHNLNRRLLIILGLLPRVARVAIKIGGFVRKLKASADPVAGGEIAFAECCIKERPEIIRRIDQFQKPVKILGNGEDFIERD
jgi:hypothetical protein